MRRVIAILGLTMALLSNNAYGMCEGPAFEEVELISELEVLYRIVEAEATGEGFEGKRLVTEVVLSRVESDLFPSNIREVVFQKNQFSPTMDGRFWEVTVTDETIDVVEQVLCEFADSDVKPLFFQNHRVSGWINENREFAFRHGNHNFYY